MAVDKAKGIETMGKSEEILTEAEIKQAIKTIFKRSQTDIDFRRLCLTNPAAAIREITGKSIPDGFAVEFRENDSPSEDKPA